MDRTNKHWNNSISDEDIFNEEFTIAYLLHTNQHIEVFKELKDLVLSTYRVIAEFSWLGFNGDSLHCNGQKLVYRKNKFSDISIGKNVTILEHNLSTSGGGSNNYPSISFKGAKVKLEFISYGLPYMHKVDGWQIKVISLEKINTL